MTDTPIDKNIPIPGDNVVSLPVPKSKLPHNPNQHNGSRKRNEYGLTTMQEAFAQHAATGATLSDAYRVAYKVDQMKPQTLWARAYKVSVMDVVKTRIDDLVAKRRKDELHDGERIRQFVIERLQLEAVKEKINDGARIRALELLGKLTDVAAFRENISQEIKDVRTSGEITEELERKLADLLGTGTTG